MQVAETCPDFPSKDAIKRSDIINDYRTLKAGTLWRVKSYITLTKKW
jgi:hypothetical protein